MKDETEPKRLFTLLKTDIRLAQAFLHRQMRLSCQHGHSKVNNQIVVDTGSYKTKVGRTCVFAPTQPSGRGRPACLPLRVCPKSRVRRNILARHSDHELHRYLPYTQVKTILVRRTQRVKERLGLLNHRVGADLRVCPNADIN